MTEADFLLGEKSSFLAQEDYKALRTNVIFSLPGKDCKCIAVTSGNRAQGKSTNAINLSIAFGQIGKRVLLIDCDMRLSTIADKLHIAGQPGLSDILVGEASPAEAIVKPKEYQIEVLPAGNVPPDPTGLLESSQFQELITALREKYEYIFMDLPPVLTVSDPVIISKYVDGFLLVVKHEQTEYREVQQAIHQLQFVGGKILGLVYVNVPVSGQKNDHRHYRKG